LVQCWMCLWTQQKKMFLPFTFSLLVFECNFIFHWVDSCAKCHVLSQLILFLVFSYPRSQLVYVSLYVLLPSCLLITLQLVSKCYWLCFEWHFEWSKIGIIDWNQLNHKMDVWNVCFSHSRFCNAIVFRALFDTCTIYKENMVPKISLSKQLQINIGC
jgi:hypothetical protein